MIDRTRGRIAAALTVLGLLLASLGGAGGLSAANAATAHKAKKHHTAKKPKRQHSCIPQTAKHTDNDPDNHGGPNDGDGCV